MALRDQPYLPLYIQDFLTDEKLKECSAESVGVYIMIMCVLHKQDAYGKVLLKQKHKQSAKQILNFAFFFAKHFAFDLLVIEKALDELISERVLIMDGDLLFQKRMVKDNEISIKRAFAGKKGGDNSLKKRKKFAQAKRQANPEYESDTVIVDDIEQGKEGLEGKPKKENRIPENYQEVLDYWAEKKYPESEAVKFYAHYDANGWVQGKDKPIKKWKSAAVGWITRANEYKNTPAITTQLSSPPKSIMV